MVAAVKRVINVLYEAPILLLTLTGLFWGGNAVAGRLAVDQVSPMLLTFLRWWLVLIVLWPIYGAEVRAGWPGVRPRLPAVVTMGTLGFTVFTALFYYAAHHTTAINIGILQGSIPVLVLAGAFAVYRSPVRLPQTIGVLITVLGVVVVATRGHVDAILALDINRGDIAMLIASMLFAFYTVALRNRPAMGGAAFFTLLAVTAAVTSVPLVMIEAWTGGLQWPTLRGWLIVTYAALFTSCLGQLFYLRGVDLIGPGRAGAFMNLIPVFAAGLGAGLLGEPFALYHAVALALVCGGIWLVQQSPQ